MNQKSKTTAILLAFFLGCWGAHHFYLGNSKRGAIYLVIGLFGLFLFIPLWITGILALIDIIRFIGMSEAEFSAKYNNNSRENYVGSSYSGRSQNFFNQSTSTPETESTISNMPSSSTTEPTNFSFCTTCGAKIPKDAKFCPSCGNVQNR